MANPPKSTTYKQALDACGGNRDAALLLLGYLLSAARGAMCGGFLRLGQPAETPTRRN